MIMVQENTTTRSRASTCPGQTSHCCRLVVGEGVRASDEEVSLVLHDVGVEVVGFQDRAGVCLLHSRCDLLLHLLGYCLGECVCVCVHV